MSRLLSKTALLLAAVMLMLVAAEFTARLHDALFSGIPFFSTPDSTSDLRRRVDGLILGRPNGHYGKWDMDARGFRKIAHTPDASRGCVSVLTMGASETFGLYESPGKEYPNVLQEKLNADLSQHPSTSGACIAVTNVGMVGMTLGSQRRYWERWVSPLHPAIVVLYPSPQFYADPGQLEESAQKGGGTLGVAATAKHLPPAKPSHLADFPKPQGFHSRFIANLKGSIVKPRWLSDWLNQNTVNKAIVSTRGHTLQHEPSRQGLELFQDTLKALIGDIQDSGAEVILVVPGHKIISYDARNASAADHSVLLLARSELPFVPEDVIVDYLNQATAEVLTVAKTSNPPIPFVDANQMMGGCRECFADDVHLTDLGAERLATALAPVVLESAHALRPQIQPIPSTQADKPSAEERK